MADLGIPAAFYFALSLVGGDEIDANFQEVSGLDAEVVVAEIREGGENRFVHKLPSAIKHQNLVVKRGIVETNSELFRWMKSTMEGGLTTSIEPKTLTVSLLNHEDKPMVIWTVHQAFPVKWQFAGIGAQDNSAAVEIIEFAYQQLERSIVQELPNPKN